MSSSRVNMWIVLIAVSGFGATKALAEDAQDAQISTVTFSQGTSVSSDAGSPYGGPHWVDAINAADPTDDWPDGEPDDVPNRPTLPAGASQDPDKVKSYPYSYSATQKPTAAASFKVKNPHNKKIKAKGVAVTAGCSFEFPKRAAPNGAYPATAANAVIVVAQKIKCFTTANRRVTRNGAPEQVSLDIQWTVWNGDEEIDAGISKHTVYVTWAAPTTTLRQETLFNLSCGVADGKTCGSAADQSSVFDAIWHEFEDRSVARMDGSLMSYYKLGQAQSAVPTTTDGLLQKANGQCLAWTTLLLDSAKIQAMGSLFHVAVNAGGDDAELLMIIKNWDPVPADNTPLHLKLPTGGSDYSCSGGNVQYGDMTSLAGLPGQNTPTPYIKIFGSHAIAKYGNNYFDPSYGTTYQNEQDFETKAIAGYGVIWSTPPAANDIYVRSPGFSAILFGATAY